MKIPNKIFNYSVLLTAVIFLSSFDNYNSKLSYQLSQNLGLQNSGDRNLIWIYFKDKGEDLDSRLSSPETFLTEKSIERRFRRIRSENIFDDKDVPVCISYINEVKATGIQIKQKSKWLNAVSCYADKVQIENLIRKDFVKKIEPVVKYFKAEEEVSDNAGSPENIMTDNPSSINYGPSLVQSTIINLPPAHNNGYTGQGVLIASLDAGFDNLQHNCFDLLRSKGLHTWDFVNGDSIVADGEGRMGSGAHGTLTLSLVGGYSPDSLVSPAYNSTYILAKTENTGSETPLEEDNWVVAAEWADSLGADVITSSLGYLGFQAPYQSYTWQDMNGQTTVITIAADIAVSRGIVVVISSGNSGYNVNHNTLDAPADGFNVITVGSVTSSRLRANYSSVGPTTDGRIKPDVMAMGSYNYTAKSGSGNTGYVNVATGTSLSCPMVAGVCALILSANPDLTPGEVRDILRTTSDKNATPDNLYGWGIVDSWAAVLQALNTNPNNPNIPADYILSQNYPNPFNPSTTFRFTLNKNANVSLIIYDESGRMMDKVIDNKFYSAGSKEFSYTNASLSSGVYFYSMIANGVLVDSKKMILIY